MAARSRVEASAALDELSRARASSRSTSAVNRACFPWNMRDAIAACSECRCHQGFRTRCCSRHPMPPPTSPAATHEPMVRSPPTSSPPDTRWAVRRRRVCSELAAVGRLLEGEFKPGGSGRMVRPRDPPERAASLVGATPQAGRAGRAAGLHAPADPLARPRPASSWSRRVAGCDRTLQGAPMPATIFESEMLANRVEGYNPSDPMPLRGRRGRLVRRGANRRPGRTSRALPDRPLVSASRHASVGGSRHARESNRRPPRI